MEASQNLVTSGYMRLGLYSRGYTRGITVPYGKGSRMKLGIVAFLLALFMLVVLVEFGSVDAQRGRGIHRNRLHGPRGMSGAV